MERKSSRMVPLTYLLVMSLMALYVTHSLAGDHRYQTNNTANERASEYWWVEANKSLGLLGDEKGIGNATSEPSYARIPYWWESSTVKQSHACRYGWQNTVNSATAPMSYWWSRPRLQDVSMP